MLIAYLSSFNLYDQPWIFGISPRFALSVSGVATYRKGSVKLLYYFQDSLEQPKLYTAGALVAQPEQLTDVKLDRDLLLLKRQ